jgi:tetratricopeptide (TPR) repeat protein
MAKADDLKAKIGLGGPPLERIDTAPPAIPDHQMVRRIGSGSYGDVWLARNAVGTWRAVKVVYRAQFKDTRPYEREFSGIQKYEPISRTNDGLVDVLQIGRNDAEGYFYYVMELADDAGPVVGGPSSAVNGPKPPFNPEAYVPKTLGRELQQRGRLPIEECITLGLTLNLALGHLHRSGLIHRDVKPSNIIFVTGVAKLADIGLVTEWAEAQSFVGTEGFIPPEGPNSPQADIYALGKVLYEASMGKDRQEFPEPRSGLGVDADSKALMELNAVLLRACAPNPKERYQSAEEMNADLALLHSGKSVQHKHAVERRLKVTTRVAAAAVAVMVLGVVPYYVAICEARQAAESATDARQEASESQQLAHFLAEMLEGAGPSVAQGMDATLLNKILAKTSQRVGTELTNQPKIEAEIRQILGKTYMELGEASNALAQTTRALKLRQDTLGPTNDAVADSLANIGAILCELDDFPNAEKTGGEALAMRRVVLGNQHPKVATSLNNVGLALWHQGKLAAAEKMHLEALQIRLKVLPPDHPDMVQSFNNLAMVMIVRGDYSGAEGLFKEALELALQSSAIGEKHPLAALYQNNIATMLAKKGELEEAQALQAKTLKLRREIYRKDHANIAYSLTQLALVTTALGRLDEAKAELLEAHEMEERLGAGQTAGAADTLIDLGAVLMKQGEFANAETNLATALQIRKKLLGPENTEVADALDALALLYASREDWDGAERMLRDGLKMSLKVLPANHPDLVPSLLHLAWVRTNQGAAAEAEEFHNQARDIVLERGIYGAQSFTDGVFDLVDVLQAKGRFNEAEPLLLEAADFCGTGVLADSSVRRHQLQHSVRFYEACGKSAEAADCRKKLAEPNLQLNQQKP